MARDFKLQKRLIIAALALLLAADVALAAYTWQSGSTPRNEKQDLADQTRQLEVLKADVKRAQGIQNRMPAIQADCDRFERSLFSASTGYSSATADLDGIAQKAGAQVQDLAFKQQEISTRGLTNVEITATINGTYSSIVRFVNGLQRSDNLYILEGLSLKGENQNPGANSQIKVNLHLQTYFRTAA
jgi:Tfp pilus assembly protein PilO